MGNQITGKSPWETVMMDSSLSSDCNLKKQVIYKGSLGGSENFITWANRKVKEFKACRAIAFQINTRFNTEITRI